MKLRPNGMALRRKWELKFDFLSHRVVAFVFQLLHILSPVAECAHRASSSHAMRRCSSSEKRDAGERNERVQTHILFGSKLHTRWEIVPRLLGMRKLFFFFISSHSIHDIAVCRCWADDDWENSSFNHFIFEREYAVCCCVLCVMSLRPALVMGESYIILYDEVFRWFMSHVDEWREERDSFSVDGL